LFVDGNRAPLLSSRGDIAVQGDVTQGDRALGGGVVQCVGQAGACINAINVEEKVLGLCLISTLSFAAAPKPDAIAEYESANQAMEQMQRGYAQL
jgi:hypothetical protein